MSTSSFTARCIALLILLPAAFTLARISLFLPYVLLATTFLTVSAAPQLPALPIPALPALPVLGGGAPAGDDAPPPDPVSGLIGSITGILVR